MLFCTTSALIFLVWLLLSSCTSKTEEWPTSRFYIEGPAISEGIKNSVIVGEAYGLVWTRLADRLASGQFSIKSIDPKAGWIRVDSLLDNPEHWIDCGRAKRSYVDGHETVRYEYAVARSVSYKSAGSWRSSSSTSGALDGWFPRLESIDRRTSINTLSVIRLTKMSAGVRLGVFVAYRFFVRFDGSYENRDRAGRTIETGALRPRTIVHTFGTNHQNTYTEGGFSVRCRSNGRLEHELLWMALP